MIEKPLTQTEQQMRVRTQGHLEAAANLLNEPVKADDVQAALRHARAAAAGLEYLASAVAGMPAPKRGD